MNGLLLWLERIMLPLTMKVVENRYMKAIRNAFISSALPMIIVGSVFLIIAFPPFPSGLTDGWLGAINQMLTHYRPMLLIPYQYTFGIISLWVCYGTASHLAKHYKLDPSRLGLVAVSTMCMFCVPIGLVQNGQVIGLNGQVIGLNGLSAQEFLDNLGAVGLFVALITGIGVVELNRFLFRKGIMIKLPPSVPSNVARSFEMMIPTFSCVGLAFLIEWWVSTTFSPQPYDPATAFTLSKLLMAKLSFLVQASDTLPSAILQILLMMILWAVGIHGMNVVSSVAYPLWQANLEANISAISSGHHATHIVTEPFFHMFAHLGGSGATLPLAVMLLRSKSQQLKSVGKVAITPAIFNINEPVTFGVPIALNPILIIPFLIAPTVIVTLNYVVMKMGLVPVPTIQPPLTMPVFLGGFLSSGSWRGAALQGIDLLLSGFIYYPFFKMWEKQLIGDAQESTNLSGGEQFRD